MKNLLSIAFAAAMLSAGANDREAVKKWFLENEYGVRPAACATAPVEFKDLDSPTDAFDGKAVKKHALCTVKGPYGDCSFELFAFLPKTEKPAPSFVFMCNRNTGAEAGVEGVMATGYWSARRMVERGYGAVMFYNSDVAADSYTGFDAYTNGIFRVMEKREERTPSSWGMLSAWAYGASKVLDWIEREPLLDATKVGVVGHSRCGKTALIAGVEDKRFAMICSNNSGCGGAKSNKMDLPRSEPNWKFKWWGVSYWFCEKFQDAFVGHEKELPYDQDEFIKLLDDRIVCVRSGQADEWAGPEGERASALSAAAAWWAKGRRQAFDYTMREGGHGLWTKCWDHYMDIADANWRGKTVVVNSSIQRALDEKSRPLTVIVPKGVYEITETLKIHSGTHLILHPEARLVVSGLKPHHVGEFLLTNADEENGDTDIRIEGGVWDGNKEVGFNLKEPQERKFDPDAWSGCTLNFRNVKNLKLSDMTLANSVTFNVRLCEVDGFEIRNIRIVSPIIKNNQDGIHLGGRCFNGVIDGVTVDTRGQTNDDLIAINADDSVTRHENRGTVNGPITNIVVRHVFAEDCHCFIRLLRAYSEIKDITVEDCAVGVRYHAINGDDARKWIAHGSGRAGCPNPPGVVSEKDLPESTGVLDNVVFRRCSFWCSWAMGYPTEQSSFPLIQLDGVLGPRGVKFEDVYRDMRLDQDRKRPTCKDERAAKLFSAR